MHANLIAGILDGTIKQLPPDERAAEFALLAIIGLSLALVLPLLNSIRSTLVTLAVLGTVVGANLWLWCLGNMVLPLASAILLILLLFGLNAAHGFFVESRARRQITGRFGQYVPPELVDEMSRQPARFSMEGESRELSVLFADVRDFTTLSEGVDPKQLKQLMNELLTPLTRVIYRHRGTIDKYMGDCVMAFWGAPVADLHHRRNAVLAGLEMLTTMDALRPELRARGWPELHIGVGVNSGRMSVGNMGSEIRVAYTVIGDAVNLASRLEGLTREYGVGMIVGEATRAGCPDVLFRELDRVRAKGKREAVAIFAPIAAEAAASEGVRDELSTWHQALEHYRAQRWERAESLLRELQRERPGVALYATFLKRIAHLRASPPCADWDGAWSFDSK